MSQRDEMSRRAAAGRAQLLAKTQHAERVQIPAELRRNRKRPETVGNGGISKRERKFREIPKKIIEIFAKNDKFD